MWTGKPSANGYAMVKTEQRAMQVHRLAYMLWVGPLEGRKHVDHVCHDPETCTPGPECPHRLCCNPAHLVLKTARANNLRSGSPSAINAAKEFCVNDHEFTPENTYIHPKRGTRHCKRCARERTAAWAARNPDDMRRRWREKKRVKRANRAA